MEQGIDNKATDNTRDIQVKKEWYKTWWGILILILFFPVALPVFGIWWIWKKTKINKPLKWVLTVFLSFVLMGVLSGIFSTPAAPNNTTATPKKTEGKPKVVIVFDVPALFGKNIDEVKTILGAPNERATGFEEPTQQQLSLGTTQWENNFKKSDYTLIVTFNPISRTVVDYFVTGSGNENGENKQKLLEISNLEEGSSEYSIEAVKMLKDPSKITGIVVTPTN